MADKLLNLHDVAQRFGLTYKSVWNRIDHIRGQIVIAGKAIKTTKDRGQWLVWESDCDNPQPIVEPQPLTPATTAKKPKRGRPRKQDWAIDFNNLGDGTNKKKGD